jgi:hypothetical protein
VRGIEWVWLRGRGDSNREWSDFRSEGSASPKELLEMLAIAAGSAILTKDQV